MIYVNKLFLVKLLLVMAQEDSLAKSVFVCGSVWGAWIIDGICRCTKLLVFLRVVWCMMVFWSNNAMCLIYVSHCLQSGIAIAIRITFSIWSHSNCDLFRIYCWLFGFTWVMLPFSQKRHVSAICYETLLCFMHYKWAFNDYIIWKIVYHWVM